MSLRLGFLSLLSACLGSASAGEWHLPSGFPEPAPDASFEVSLEPRDPPLPQPLFAASVEDLSYDAAGAALPGRLPGVVEQPGISEVVTPTLSNTWDRTTEQMAIATAPSRSHTSARTVDVPFLLILVFALGHGAALLVVVFGFAQSRPDRKPVSIVRQQPTLGRGS